MNLREVAIEYFLNFQNKDIDALSEMFHEQVTLRDWEINASGKKLVVAANENIFNSVGRIKIDLENLYINELNVVAELMIHADDNDPLLVVDIIDFDMDYKICSIKAYRGN